MVLSGLGFGFGVGLVVLGKQDRRFWGGMKGRALNSICVGFGLVRAVFRVGGSFFVLVVGLVVLVPGSVGLVAMSGVSWVVGVDLVVSAGRGGAGGRVGRRGGREGVWLWGRCCGGEAGGCVAAVRVEPVPGPTGSMSRE